MVKTTDVIISISTGISVFFFIFNTALVRGVANLLLVLASATTVFAPIIWFIVQNEIKKTVPILILQIGAAVFAFVAALMTFAALSRTNLAKWTI